MVLFQQGLVHQIGQHRSGGVIIDVAALDVLGSFGSRTLSNIAEIARLRGAATVIIGIEPSVAFAMVELGMDASALETAVGPRTGPCPPQPPKRKTGWACTDTAHVSMTELQALKRDYRAAFLRYLLRREEAPLHVGYEIGRSAVAGGLGILDIAQVHHDVLLEVLRDTRADHVSCVGTAASEFLVEVLSTYDMAHRGFLGSGDAQQ